MDEKLEAFGSGNVFADLGIPNPEEHRAKSRLVAKISAVIRERGLTQAEAATITGVPQPKISGLVRGQFRDFSSDRLCRMLNRLGVTVSMVLVDEPDWSPGATTVSEAEEAHARSEPAMSI
ncbi:MAG: helix-turn-helix transcriptional regulator [Devosia sp.]|nr:helix-turn-helix transcriptional regulator [Devosia sp.]